jgi:hypothetical protein
MTGTVEAARRAILTPPGAPGSGRLRYGAAMTLHQAGLLPAPALEAYRECSPADTLDPAAALAARGCAPPGAEIGALVAAAADYLATLPGPGVAEVLAGLATAAAVPPAPRSGPVVAAHLAPALAAVARPAGLAAAIGAAAPWLAWAPYDGYPAADIGPVFPRSHAAAALAAGRDFELGLFLIAPRVLYRDHAHAAPELYAPLTGPHGWRFAPGAAMEARPAHAPVWNPPHRPHAMLTGEVPFLCLYAWTRDVNELAYVIPAPDWAGMERP